MHTESEEYSASEPRMSAWEWCWRSGWIGVRLILVYIMIDQFQPFFYQAF